MNENPNIGMTADGRPYAIYPAVQAAPVLQREYLGGKLTLEQINFITRRAAELGGFNKVEDRAVIEDDGSPVMEWYDETGVYQQHITITPLRQNEHGQVIGGGDVIREWLNPKGEVIKTLPSDIQERQQVIPGGDAPFDNWRSAKLEFEELYELDAGMWTLKPETEETKTKKKGSVN